MEKDKERLEHLVGYLVWLDAGRTNQSKVTLVHIYGTHFGRVSDGHTEWDVMLNRLTAI